MTHKRARRGEEGFAEGPWAKPGDPPERTSGEAHAFSLRALNQRPLSIKQLTDKLTKAGFSGAQAQQAVREMQNFRYLDDARLAEAVARDAERRGKGPAWIRQALSRRGLADALLAEREPDPTRPTALAQALVQLARRYPDRSVLKEPKQKARVLRFLAARGFSGKDAYAGLAELLGGLSAQED